MEIILYPVVGLTFVTFHCKVEDKLYLQHLALFLLLDACTPLALTLPMKPIAVPYTCSRDTDTSCFLVTWVVLEPEKPLFLLKSHQLHRHKTNVLLLHIINKTYSDIFVFLSRDSPPYPHNSCQGDPGNCSPDAIHHSDRQGV